MSYMDNWSQRSRYDRRYSHIEEPKYVMTLAKLIDRFDVFDSVDEKDKLLERFTRILSSSHKDPSIRENESDIAHAIHDKIKENEGYDSAFRFGHLYNKLVSLQRLSKKWSILYLLSLLSQSQPNTEFENLSMFDERGLQNIDQDLDFLQPPTSRPFEQDDDSRNTRRKLSEYESPASILARAKESQRIENKIYVSESDLLRDLIFLFQGIDGQYIRYDHQLNDHVFTTSIDISRPAQDMVFKLAEIGWLYTKVRDFIKLNVDSPSIGLVGQSLCAALQHELIDYYKLIAILEAQIEKQIKNPSMTDQSLTLKRLMVWTLDCNQKLRLMSVLVDVCQGQKGGALISIIHNYTKHGDPFIKKYLVSMLQTISKPFYEMLERWVYEGELDDPYDEFFVACGEAVSEEELWQSKYTLREDMLPSFLSKELANKIFSIGKSLNFIRYSCHDDTLTHHYRSSSPSSVIPRQTLKYGETELVEKSIEVAYKETSKSLLDLLKTKYRLMDHLKALKRYLLLSQGDFIQYLMDILWVNLSKPANTLFKHNLTGILETAVRSSNAQYDDPEILNRLDVRLLEIQKDDLGWDVFSLEYHVDAPINTVFNPTAMKQYLQIFNFLWRLKRVEYTLSSAWRQWGKANREFSTLTYIKQDIQYVQLTIQRMIHFIYQLQHYVLFEVLECSWDKLETFIENDSVDLDSIIKAHHDYLLEITKKGFLSGTKEQALSDRLHPLFDCILQYSDTLDQLYRYATWDLSRTRTRSPEILEKIRERHQALEDDFTQQVLAFLKTLKSYHDEDLRSLSTRLDYNDFHLGPQK